MSRGRALVRNPASRDLECGSYSSSEWNSTWDSSMADSENSSSLVYDEHEPLHADEERANAITHAAAAIITLAAGAFLLKACYHQSLMTIFCCFVFVSSTIGVFVASALSHHWISEPGLLRRLRAWDQGLIYSMIAGTYTPLIWRYVEDPYRMPLLFGMWIAAGVGFSSKVLVEHRVNSIGLTTYLLLGFVPAFWLFHKVPTGLLLWMVGGGAAYVFGVTFLMYDRRVKYLHVVWHLCVMVGASLHFMGVYNYVALTP